jgi:hypothetical protein
VARSCTKIPVPPGTLSGVRFVANDAKTTSRPSPLTAGLTLSAFACVPSLATLTLVVVPAARSWTKMSFRSFVSPGTRFAASDWKTTIRPSALSLDHALDPLPGVPSLATLAHVVTPVRRSRTNTWGRKPVRHGPATTSGGLAV